MLGTIRSCGCPYKTHIGSINNDLAGMRVDCTIYLKYPEAYCRLLFQMYLTIKYGCEWETSNKALILELFILIC